MGIFDPSEVDINSPVSDNSRASTRGAITAERTKEQMLASAGVSETIIDEFEKKLAEFTQITKLSSTDIYELQFLIKDSDGKVITTVQIPINSTDRALSDEEAKRVLLARFLGQIASNPSLKQSKDLVADLQFGYYGATELSDESSKFRVFGMRFWPDSTSIRATDGSLVPGSINELFGISVEMSHNSDVGMGAEMRNQRLRDLRNNKEALDRGDHSSTMFPGVRVTSRGAAAPDWLPIEIKSGVSVYHISATTVNGETISLDNITPEKLQRFYQDLISKGHLGATITIKYYGENESISSSGAKDKKVTFKIPGL